MGILVLQAFHFTSLPNVLSSVSQNPLSRIVGGKGIVYSALADITKCLQSGSPLSLIRAVDESL